MYSTSFSEIYKKDPRRNTLVKLRQMAILTLASLTFTTSIMAMPAYLDADEYYEAASGDIYEDKGIVVENEPYLGYLVYRNAQGEQITANYYRQNLVVEKQPFYESSDRIGYLDELFPNFQFDPRDTTIDKVKPGDNVYLRMNREGDIQYISAYNDYIMRYGKVKNWDVLGAGAGTLTLEDDRGRLYTYTIPMNTPITKGGRPYSLGAIKPGEYIKVLVAQKTLGEGIVEEEAVELVVDNDTRVISDVYKGELMSIDGYKNTLGIAHAQRLGKTNWGPYTDVLTLRADPRNLEAYFIGNPVSWDYMSRTLRGGNYVYTAVEDFMGKETAVKLNFQSKMQKTLPTTEVIYASPGVIKLLTGETLYLAKDAILVKDKRLIEPHNIMIGDTVQTVVTGENKVAVANVLSAITTGDFQIFRGRIRKVKDRQAFEVETFSLLEDSTWYFHPEPRTFAIDYTTKFYTDKGFVAKGIEEFLTYGENSQVDEVYTILAIGDKAVSITNAPYSKESIKGNVYKVEGDTVFVKDVNYYHSKQKKWVLYSKKNTGVAIEIKPNTMIIKEGQLVPASELEIGDKLTVMLEKSIKDSQPGGGDNASNQVKAPGYILVVE